MSELEIAVLIIREGMLFSRKIYTTGKKIALPPAVPAVTNVYGPLNALSEKMKKFLNKS